jgi:hypothetical protein
MKNLTGFFVGLCLLILLACYGCSENSEIEMNQAQQAMDKAKSFHADDLTPTDWKEAVQVWDQAQAAVKDAKPAKALFVRAKNRFEKISSIAKSKQDGLSKELKEIQASNKERFDKIKKALDTGNLVAKAQAPVKSLVSQIDEGNASITKLLSAGDYLKAVTTAKDVQKKMYNAELIMAGEKPTI